MINDNKFDLNMLKDPKIFKVNCLPAHSDHVVYRTDEELKRGENSFRECLDGIWKFHYAKNLKETIPGFEKPEYDTSDWDDIHAGLCEHTVSMGRKRGNPSGADSGAFQSGGKLCHIL